MSLPRWKPLYYRQLWPLFTLILLEAIALGWLFGQPEQHPQVLFTPFSVLVAGLILLCGLLPALLRPGPETHLAGFLAAVMASLLVTPFGAQELPGVMGSTPVAAAVTGHLLLRLINGAALGPLVFHLAARFPRRADISQRSIAMIYTFSLAALATVLFTRTKEIRIGSALVLAAWSVGLVVGAAALLFRASRAAGPEQVRVAQQARLLFLSLVLAETPALLRPLGLAFRLELVPYDFFLALQILVPVGIAYAVLRHDLFGIDNALRRALAYAAFSLLWLGVYLALTVGLTARLVAIWPEFRILAALVSLFLAALAFEPSRRRVQYWIDRALYPDRLHFQQALADAQNALARVVDREQVVHLLTEDLPPRLGAVWASLSLAPAPDVPGQAGSEPAWNAQLMVGGRSLGRYWLGPRRAGPSYDPDEQAQLGSLAGQAALALAYADTIEALARLNRELEGRVAQRTAQVLDQQRSLAAFEERQRLARDLHDSVTQALFSINLSARALRGLVKRDPPSAVTGLEELEQAAQQALAEMRALLAQLRSPAAGDGAEEVELSPDRAETETSAAGQEPANLKLQLIQLGEQFAREVGPDGRPPRLQVSFDLPDALALPARQAEQVFLMIREALQNAARHSGVRQAACQVRRLDTGLEIAVHDQGAGFETHEASPAGYGLQGMRERVQALGGEMHIRSSPGVGTTVQIRIPYG